MNKANNFLVATFHGAESCSQVGKHCLKSYSPKHYIRNSTMPSLILNGILTINEWRICTSNIKGSVVKRDTCYNFLYTSSITIAWLHLNYKYKQCCLCKAYNNHPTFVKNFSYLNDFLTGHSNVFSFLGLYGLNTRSFFFSSNSFLLTVRPSRTLKRSRLPLVGKAGSGGRHDKPSP